MHLIPLNFVKILKITSNSKLINNACFTPLLIVFWRSKYYFWLLFGYWFIFLFDTKNKTETNFKKALVRGDSLTSLIFYVYLHLLTHISHLLIIISINLPRRYSCLTFRFSQSARRIYRNTPLWLAAAHGKTTMTLRSISRWLKIVLQ